MPLLVEDANIYSLASREFYETLDRLIPNENEFVAIARRRLPHEWEYSRGGVWYHCRPPGTISQGAGWKIHLSATLGNAPALLATVCELLGPAAVQFKFLVDVSAFRLLNSKRWPRGGSGKFITVYPPSTDACGDLLDQLHRATVGFVGPYILSDRRYRDSRVVHYRYGGFRRQTRLTIAGDPVHTIPTPGGGTTDDERLPYFHLPDGVSDPFTTDTPTVSDSGEVVLGGRYTVEAALAFANSGGVYIARDQRTDTQVIVKEARPYTTQSPVGTESVSLLMKEHRLLARVADLRIAPAPVEFFQDWEHFYLAQEYAPGDSLRTFQQTTLNIALHPCPTRDDLDTYFSVFRLVFRQIIEAVQRLHERGIIFGDLSPNNILVADGGARITLIDFEGAHEIGVDVPPVLYTPGFAAPEMIEHRISDVQTDTYAVGALMLAALMPINGLSALNPRWHEPFVQSFVRDLGFPSPVARCIARLLSPQRDHRATLAEAQECLAHPSPTRTPRIGATELAAEDPESLIEEMVSYIESVADYTREDRLYPGAPYLFRTNPLSIAYGACGVALATQFATGTVADRVVDWIRARAISTDTYAPGLMVGMAGVSWALADLGDVEGAEAVLRPSEAHPLLWSSPDLYYGASGWGLAQLRLFAVTDDERYLDNARTAAAHVARTSEGDGEHAYWIVDGATYAGLGHGVAGISLFLLRMYQVTRDQTYLDLGMRALKFVLSIARPTTGDGLEWAFKEGERTVTPYWRWGSAGIGAVLLRYMAAIGVPEFAAPLDRITVACDRKYSVFPGLHLGLAGLAEFLLDRQAYIGDGATDAAAKPLAGLLAFKLRRAGGIAFPGETRARISCDFATGGAGILRVITRMARGGSAPFMLDEFDHGIRVPSHSSAMRWPATPEPAREHNCALVHAQA